MAGKGPMDAKIDTQALNEVIVFANQYRIDVKDQSERVRRICMNMQTEESLSGGDGDVIRDNFMKIAVCCEQLDNSTEYIVKVLNDKLGAAIQLRHGAAIGNSTESMDAAVKNTGVFKE